MARKKLSQFTVSQEDGAFTIHVEDDGGDTLELNATRGQLDLIADTLDDLLDQTEEEDEVDLDDDEDENGQA